jgi:adenylate cyclase
MGTEIERKFLIDPARLPALPAPMHFRQGYLSTQPAVRVRAIVSPSGERSARLTIKGPGHITRVELEYPIPPEDTDALFALCQRSLTKLRYKLGRWEIDHFLDLPRGDFWLAEIELTSESEAFERPAWIVQEVTDDPGYANSKLAGPT